MSGGDEEHQTEEYRYFSLYDECTFMTQPSAEVVGQDNGTPSQRMGGLAWWHDLERERRQV